ncbi:hypothetical protein E4U11_007458, partial [Claviceps purpurea]
MYSSNVSGAPTGCEGRGNFDYPSVPLPPSETCSGRNYKRLPATDFSLKDPLGDADGERYRVCAPCTAKWNIRRPPKRNIEQVGQQDDEPPPARRQRLSTVSTEAVGAAGTGETLAIDISTRCSGCMRWLPLSDFPRRSDGARAPSHGRYAKTTNRWVVPYNSYLLHKYQAHINVELCDSI